MSFRNGRPDRANYRRFKIKTVEGQDDFASMAEVVRRRYTRLLKESKPKVELSPGAAGEREKLEANEQLPRLPLRTGTPQSARRICPT